MPQCSYCGNSYESTYKMSQHIVRVHESGAYETTEEYMNDVVSEQRDFDGSEPDDSDYSPEYETTNDVDDGEKVTLDEWDDDDE